MINVSRKIADVWISNPDVADVHIANARQLNLFGKKNGEATLIATAADGSVVYATEVRVSQNLSGVNEMLRAAMPDSDIAVTTVGQIAVINGTVASPQDAAQAQMIVTSLLNPGKMFPVLHRCAELGRVHVHGGKTRFPDLPRF